MAKRKKKTCNNCNNEQCSCIKTCNECNNEQCICNDITEAVNSAIDESFIKIDNLEFLENSRPNEVGGCKITEGYLDEATPAVGVHSTQKLFNILYKLNPKNTIDLTDFPFDRLKTTINSKVPVKYNNIILITKNTPYINDINDDTLYIFDAITLDANEHTEDLLRMKHLCMLNYNSFYYEMNNKARPKYLNLKRLVLHMPFKFNDTINVYNLTYFLFYAR